MRNANGQGSVIKLRGNRRKPYAVRITAGWENGKQKYKYIGYYQNIEKAKQVLESYNITDVSGHNVKEHRLYGIYNGMLYRCYSRSSINYKNYGGRGIIVCDEWRNNFMFFFMWALANGYEDDLTIDRIDVNGNYEPSNCRWATVKEQANNKRNNHYVTYKDETHTMSEWAEITGINYGSLSTRLNKLGWDEERALKTSVK